MYIMSYKKPRHKSMRVTLNAVPRAHHGGTDVSVNLKLWDLESTLRCTPTGYRKNPHRLLNKEPGNYSDVINTYLDWSFQDLVLGHNDGMTGDDIAGEWLLSTTYTRHLWGRAWLMLPVSVRSKYKLVGG